jgi:hypothetical protein
MSDLKPYKADINALQNILDYCQVSADYVEFGSTNDYDRFKEIVQRLYYDACLAPWLHEDAKRPSNLAATRPVT